ncbi:MAG: DUF4124 domain-containing protein [Gammaproteobacteria bacterium]
MTTRQSKFHIRNFAFGPWALALSLGAGAVAPASADGGIYLCVDANGRRELTDTNRPGCKEISVPGAISAPPARRASGTAAPKAAPAPAPANFPRVDTAQQKARDDDRRAILAEELRNEERKLAGLKKDFNGGEPERQGNEKNYAKYQERVAGMQADINRSERNVEALRREIGNIT